MPCTGPLPYRLLFLNLDIYRNGWNPINNKQQTFFILFYAGSYDTLRCGDSLLFVHW